MHLSTNKSTMERANNKYFMQKQFISLYRVTMILGSHGTRYGSSRTALVNLSDATRLSAFSMRFFILKQTIAIIYIIYQCLVSKPSRLRAERTPHASHIALVITPHYFYINLRIPMKALTGVSVFTHLSSTMSKYPSNSLRNSPHT